MTLTNLTSWGCLSLAPFLAFFLLLLCKSGSVAGMHRDQLRDRVSTDLLVKNKYICKAFSQFWALPVSERQILTILPIDQIRFRQRKETWLRHTLSGRIATEMCFSWSQVQSSETDMRLSQSTVIHWGSEVAAPGQTWHILATCLTASHPSPRYNLGPPLPAPAFGTKGQKGLPRTPRPGF